MIFFGAASMAALKLTKAEPGSAFAYTSLQKGIIWEQIIRWKYFQLSENRHFPSTAMCIWQNLDP